MMPLLGLRAASKAWSRYVADSSAQIRIDDSQLHQRRLAGGVPGTVGPTQHGTLPCAPQPRALSASGRECQRVAGGA
jgi:hypothetical protein